MIKKLRVIKIVCLRRSDCIRCSHVSKLAGQQSFVFGVSSFRGFFNGILDNLKIGCCCTDIFTHRNIHFCFDLFSA